MFVCTMAAFLSLPAASFLAASAMLKWSATQRACFISDASC